MISMTSIFFATFADSFASFAVKLLTGKIAKESAKNATKSLPVSSHFIHGPVSEHGLTIDIANSNRPKVAAVVRHGAIVAQHEVAVDRHHDLGIGTLVGVGSRHIVFFQGLAVDEYFPRFNADMIARQPDHPFDKALRGIARVAEHHDVATLDGLQAIHVLVDKDALLVVHRMHHARALDLHRLVHKNNNERGNGQRDEQVAQPYRQHRQSARRNGCGTLVVAGTRIPWAGLFPPADSTIT